MKTMIEMAREAGFLQEHIWYSKALEQFAELVRADLMAEKLDPLIALARADEREACAKVAEQYQDPFCGHSVAAAIRDRGNT